MENKTERHQFNPRLEAEDPDEVRLGLLLRKQSAQRKTVRLGSRNRSTCKVEIFPWPSGTQPIGGRVASYSYRGAFFTAKPRPLVIFWPFKNASDGTFSRELCKISNFKSLQQSSDLAGLKMALCLTISQEPLVIDSQTLQKQNLSWETCLPPHPPLHWE